MMVYWVWKHADNQSTLAPFKEFKMADKEYLTFTDDIIEAAKRWESVDKGVSLAILKRFEAFLEIKTDSMNLERKLFAKITEHSAERLALLMSPYYATFIKMWLIKNAG